VKFVAVSDTHDNLQAVRDLVDLLKKEKFDFVVHAGDIIAPFTLREFESLGKKCYIAFGNNDGEKGLLIRICTENSWEIGDIVEFPGGVVYHGTDGRIIKVLQKIPGILVLGHTHQPRIERGDKLIINPGEACGYLTGKRSIAFVEDEEVSLVEF